MKRSATIAILAAALVVVSVVPSQAWVRVWFGPPWPFWYYPPPPYYIYAPPPPVIVQEPPVYVQRPLPPPPPAPPAPPQAYWYYCPSAKAYYPTVSTCAEPWVKIPPRS